MMDALDFSTAVTIAVPSVRISHAREEDIGGKASTIEWIVSQGPPGILFLV